MTEKQERILTCALDLFANQGFQGTSTAKVAKAAGVSEGLIFRHFQNKDGLLKALLENGAEKAAALYQTTFEIEEPKAKLQAIIALPFSIEKKEYAFWKLIYSLKWQAESYDSTLTRPVKDQLTACFAALGYAEPKTEADTVLMIQDGIATTLILKKPKNAKKLMQCLLDKYAL